MKLQFLSEKMDRFVIIIVVVVITLNLFFIIRHSCYSARTVQAARELYFGITRIEGLQVLSPSMMAVFADGQQIRLQHLFFHLWD